MARINLLPWREAYRQEKKREFISIMVGVLAVSAFIAYLWYSSVQAAITDQQSRNRMLESEIAALEEAVQEIQELKEDREELLARMQVIQDLEGKRPVIVRYFDDMVRAIPDGVFLNRMERDGPRISLRGIAESNNRVSSFMRNLNDSDWFAEPNLSAVTAAPEHGEEANSFQMSVSTSTPDTDSDEDEGDE